MNFSFLKEYLLDFIVAIVGALILYVIVTLMLSAYSSEFVSIIKNLVDMIMIAGISLMFAIVMGISGYNTSRTRKRFIEEFNMFMQSLASKKD